MKCNPVLIDIYQDILEVYYKGYIKVFPVKLQKQMISKSSIGKFLQGLVYLISYKKKWLVGLFQRRNHLSGKDDIINKVWFFADTQNQWTSLVPFFERLKNVVWVGQYRSFGDDRFYYLSGFWRLFFALKFFKIYRCLKNKNHLKATEYAEIIFEAAGLFEYCLYLLKKYKPQKIILSSDHGLFARSLIHAAKQCRIPTVYIQHASVHKYFPNLRADLNLLEGQHALDIYKEAGPVMGEVQLIGMPKFDKFLKFRKNEDDVSVIGIALNPADDLKIIKEVILTVANKYPHIQFVFRKHPRDNRNLELNALLNIKESNSKIENAFQFLKNIDLLIAGDSSIHLEATLLNIPCVYYCFTGHYEMKDFYGYIQNGMIEDATTMQQLLEFIQKNILHKGNVVTKAKYYNYLVGTENEGRSIDISIGLIDQL